MATPARFGIPALWHAEQYSFQRLDNFFISPARRHWSEGFVYSCILRVCVVYKWKLYISIASLCSLHNRSELWSDDVLLAVVEIPSDKVLVFIDSRWRRLCGGGCGFLAWKQLAKTRKAPSERSLVCSAHFKEDTFDPSQDLKVSLGLTPQNVRFVRRLLPTAVPTVFTRHLAPATATPKASREAYHKRQHKRVRGFCFFMQVRNVD